MLTLRPPHATPSPGPARYPLPMPSFRLDRTQTVCPTRTSSSSVVRGRAVPSSSIVTALLGAVWAHARHFRLRLPTRPAQRRHRLLRHSRLPYRAWTRTMAPQTCTAHRAYRCLLICVEEWLGRTTTTTSRPASCAAYAAAATLRLRLRHHRRRHRRPTLRVQRHNRRRPTPLRTPPP